VAVFDDQLEEILGKSHARCRLKRQTLTLKKLPPLLVEAARDATPTGQMLAPPGEFDFRHPHKDTMRSLWKSARPGAACASRSLIASDLADGAIGSG
jgi:hypothetical protein